VVDQDDLDAAAVHDAPSVRCGTGAAEPALTGASRDEPHAGPRDVVNGPVQQDRHAAGWT